jgi:hypothetical protein
MLRPFENFDLKLQNTTSGKWCVAVPYSVCWRTADMLIYSKCSSARMPLLHQSAQGTVNLLFAANLPHVLDWLRRSPEDHEQTRKILSSDLHEHSEVSPPIKEYFLQLERQRRLLHCIDACARACLLLQQLVSEDHPEIPDYVCHHVYELVVAAAEHFLNKHHTVTLRKIVLVRSAIGAIRTVTAGYLESSAAQLSSAAPRPVQVNPLSSQVLQAVLAICDRSCSLLASVPNITKSTSSFHVLRRNISASSPHILPALDSYTSHALSCSLSIPVVEMLVKTTNLMFMSQFTWPLDASVFSFTFAEEFSKTYLPVVITQVGSSNFLLVFKQRAFVLSIVSVSRTLREH